MVGGGKVDRGSRKKKIPLKTQKHKGGRGEKGYIKDNLSEQSDFILQGLDVWQKTRVSRPSEHPIGGKTVTKKQPGVGVSSRNH